MSMRYGNLLVILFNMMETVQQVVQLKRAVIPTMRLSPFLKMDSADQVMLLPGGR